MLIATLSGRQVDYLVLGLPFIAIGCVAVAFREKLVNRKLHTAEAADARIRRWMWVAAAWIVVGVFWIVQAVQ